MRNAKIDRLLTRQQAIRDAIKEETRHAKTRKQKALFAAVQRAGLLDLSDDQIEAVLKAYQPKADGTGNDGGSEA